MTLAVGDRLDPKTTFVRIGPDGPEAVVLDDRLRGRRVIIFGLPGAFTPTCDSSHLPSFVSNKAAFDAKGIDEIVCVSVNDAHVMRLWGETSGATAAGITLLGDPDSRFTKAIGMAFSNPKVGFHDRCKRFVAVIEDGTVTHLQTDAPGVCALTTGNAILEVL